MSSDTNQRLSTEQTQLGQSFSSEVEKKAWQDEINRAAAVKGFVPTGNVRLKQDIYQFNGTTDPKRSKKAKSLLTMVVLFTLSIFMQPLYPNAKEPFINKMLGWGQNLGLHLSEDQ